MADRTDIETFLDDVKGLCAGKLTEYLARVEADKDDGIGLPTVDSDQGYFFQNLGMSVPNIDPFIVYGARPPEVSEASGSGLAEKQEIFVVLVQTNMGADQTIFRKAFRYQRALKELFSENWRSLKSGQLAIKRISPYVPDGEALENHIAVGVTFLVSIVG